MAYKRSTSKHQPVHTSCSLLRVSCITGDKGLFWQTDITWLPSKQIIRPLCRCAAHFSQQAQQLCLIHQTCRRVDR
jgi:hypothetical protein